MTLRSREARQARFVAAEPGHDVQDLIAAEKSVQDMERKAFRMDAEEQGSGIEALLERIGSRE